jgi:zinc protease
MTRTPMKLVVAATTGLVLVASPVFAQQSPPAPLPLAELTFPDFQERTLSNGADLIVVAQHEVPFVSINLVFGAGTVRDPRGMEGLASMTAQLLNKGTESRTALDIAEAVDFIGASLGASAASDRTTVSLGALTPDLPVALDVMADIVMNPVFPDDELELIRTQTLTALQLQLSQAAALADINFRRAVYGEHPYGRSEVPATVEAITREAVADFHDSFYRPNNALFVVAGDVEADDVANDLEEAFRGWAPGEVPALSYPDVPAPSSSTVLLVNKPGSVQSSVRIGHTLMRGDDDDWTAFNVANRVLGAGSSGRLFASLREASGWTYGAYSDATRRQDVGMLRGYMEVRNEVTDSAVAGMLDEFRKMRGETVPADEFERVQSYLVGAFPRQIETPQQIASQVAEYRLLGLSQEDLEQYRSRVASLTPEDILEAANAHIHPERAVIVVVGDAAQVSDKLEEFGPVTIVDVEGNPISLGDLEVRASEMSFDATVLSEGTWTYNVVFQGQAVGTMERSLAFDGATGLYTLESSMAAGPQTVVQTSVFNSAFEAVSAANSIAAMGQEFGGEVRIENGRAVGSMHMPQGDSEFDEEVVTGTVLGEMEELAVWITDLDANPEFTFPAFSTEGGAVANVAVRVVGNTEVTVPAGTFQAYEVQLTGADGSNQTMYVRLEAPHVLLKLEVGGQPVVLEAATIS